jgi:5-methylcytosine-specific restriction endonuclease McrA
LRRDYCNTRCRLSAKYAATEGSTHRRRAKRYGVAYEYIDKRRIFERDGWVCQLCGCDTPEHLQGTTDPQAPQLDHKRPISKGGPHLKTNVQCACRRCNTSKGDKVGWRSPWATGGRGSCSVGSTWKPDA